MLFLPAAALCWCSALVTMAAQLFQDDPELTKRVGESVSIDCDGTNQCTSLSRVNWYQKKETGTFKDFQTASTLNIKNVGLEHSATYYCYCWVSQGGYTYSHLIFGSGTKLSVTDGNQKRTTQAPRVHANTQQSPTRPAGPRVHVDVNSSLLCVPPAMFPPLVQLSCKRQKRNGGEPEELPPAEGEQLELIHEQENSTYKCNCYIKDVSSSTVESRTQQEVPAPAASCPPEREPADLPALQPADLSFQSQCRVKLLCLLYTVLIVKSLVYCCGLSLLMILTNKGPSTNCTHAD